MFQPTRTVTKHLNRVLFRNHVALLLHALRPCSSSSNHLSKVAPRRSDLAYPRHMDLPKPDKDMTIHGALAHIGRTRLHDKGKYYFYNLLELLEETDLELHVSGVNEKLTMANLYYHIDVNKLTLNIMKALYEAIACAEGGLKSSSQSINDAQCNHMLLIEPYISAHGLFTVFESCSEPMDTSRLVDDNFKLFLSFLKTGEKTLFTMDLCPVRQPMRDVNEVRRLKLGPIYVPLKAETGERIAEKDRLWKEIFQTYRIPFSDECALPEENPLLVDRWQEYQPKRCVGSRNIGRYVIEHFKQLNKIEVEHLETVEGIKKYNKDRLLTSVKKIEELVVKI